MNIIIAGMGVVGRHVAKKLSQERQNIILLDVQEDALEQAGNEIDAMIIRGHAANERTLRQAGVDNCDLFMAVTNSDEVNFIAALRAKHMGAQKAIARATAPVYFEEERGLYKDMFGIDLVINPKFLVAIEIHKLIRTQGAVEVKDFADNQIETVQLPILHESKVTDRPLKDIRSKYLPRDVLLVAIFRRGGLIIPHGANRLQVGDEILCFGRVERIPEVEQLFGLNRSLLTRKVIIVGGGDIGASLARYLQSDKIKVQLVEPNPQRSRELREQLSDRYVQVIQGEATNTQLLEQLGVSTSDVFVSVSQEDEVNLMASLLAKELGAKRCISLVHKPDYSQVLQRLGLDTTLSPRRLVAQEVLKHARRGKTLSITPVMGGRGEFIDFEVGKNAKITGRPLKEVNWPRGALVCAVINKDGATIPSGETQIHAGDRVSVFTTPRVRRQVERYF